MPPDFHERQDWWGVTAAFVIWGAHFMAMWAFSVIFPAQSTARWIALPLTLAAWASLAWLWRRRRPTGNDAPILRLAIAVSAGAIAFGVLPAVIG